MDTFEEISREIGQAGRQVTEMGAAEGAAGNISVFTQDVSELPSNWRSQGVQPLPAAAPALAGGWLAVTGTGRRLRDVAAAPETALCLLHILPGGEQAERFSTADVRPTSELNSHLAIHNSQLEANPALKTHAIVHAQPVYLTYLSHIERYSQAGELSRRLLRWQPETILVFPDGIELTPFEVPGSPAQMATTVQALRRCRLMIWQRHGVVARSERGAIHAADLVEYAEAAARYEYLNLQAGEPSQGLSQAELQAICRGFGVQSALFG